MLKYKLLYQDNDIEIRKYPPCRRTIMVWTGNSLDAMQYYFVPLPYQIYAGVRNYYCNDYGPGRLFFTAFANKEDGFVYPTPFYRIDKPVCVDMDWHYGIPYGADIGEAITRYWSTHFRKGQLHLIERMLKIEDIMHWSKRKRIYVKYGKRPLQNLIERYKYLSKLNCFIS